jgi:two-component system osmolarity sensor histidine kinase EnvZ
VSRLIRPATLLGRTIQALALAFLLFGLLATALLEFTLVRPNTKQAADDLAAFLVLAAQIWVELPPYTRPDYEREMMDRHHLRILQAEAPYPAQAGVHSYLSYLESALADHLHQAIQIHQHPDYPGWLWADLPMGGRMLRLGFRESRLQNPTVLILPFLAVTGLFIAFATIRSTASDSGYSGGETPAWNSVRTTPSASPPARSACRATTRCLR